MRGRIRAWLMRGAIVAAIGFSVNIGYKSGPGLALRAWLGQSSGSFLYALDLYERGKIGASITAIQPLVEAGDSAALNLLCGFVNGREPVAPDADACVPVLEKDARQRLTSLTDLAIWAQEWQVAAALIDHRLAQGDMTAHFDRARLIRAAPQGQFDPAALLAAIESSNAAQDPRGQYAAVVQSLNMSSGGALSPVLAELLDRNPKLRAADAYFELAKLMQTGAISSDLGYVDVLRRADAGGNVHAASHLAQYYLSNPGLDPSGRERDLWIGKAAAAGDPVAQYNLALAKLADTGSATARPEAITLLDQAAAAGFVPAMNLLGATLWQDPALMAAPKEAVQRKAMDLMEQAAAKDDANALFNLANIALAAGDADKAKTYLQRAAALDSAPARELLARLDERAD